MKKELVKREVIFDKNTHSYSLNGRRLRGVTPIVKWMYPDTYKDIPEAVLMKAAEHGSLIHSKCELYDNTGIIDEKCPQLMDYVRLKKEANLTTIANEYLVDDGKEIASSIDVVYEGVDDTYHLGDIKTTSSIHFENVTLQLSIYAWLFERCNPGKKVSQISIIWLPKEQYGQAEIMKLRRISSDLCEKIVNSYIADEDSMLYPQKISEEYGETTTNVPAPVEGTLPEMYAKTEKMIADYEKKISEMKAKETELREGILQAMQKENVKKWTGKKIELIRKSSSVRTSVDSTKLKKEHPDIWNECKKSTNVKESLTINLIDNE